MVFVSTFTSWWWEGFTEKQLYRLGWEYISLQEPPALVRGSLFKVNFYDCSAHLVGVALNSISHSPSDPVPTSSSSSFWKEVGNPQCWESPGSPDGHSGLGWTSSARKACMATDSHPHCIRQLGPLHRAALKTSGSRSLKALCISHKEE